jgi:hypothetical protein
VGEDPTKDGKFSKQMKEDLRDLLRLNDESGSLMVISHSFVRSSQGYGHSGRREESMP